MTASNGKIIDIYGLHPANVNDATILSEIMKKEDLKHFQSFLEDVLKKWKTKQENLQQ